MEEEICLDTYTDLITTHSFLYKGKKFPFNMDQFKTVSHYFNSIQYQSINISDINLSEKFEDDLNIPDSSINDFINFCHKNKIILNKENALPLHKLSTKFLVPSLLKATEKFISKHNEEFVIDILLMKNAQNEFKTSEYEEIISNNMLDYIKSGKLLSLPIPILYRITTKYQQKNLNESMKPEMQTEFVEFLFKCLDQFGKKASVLFDHFNFEFSDGKVIRRLLDGYSEKFDFHFINSAYLKNVYELESQIIEREKKISLEFERQQIREEERQREFEQAVAKLNDEREKDERKKALSDEAIKKQQDDCMKKLEALSEQVRLLAEKVAQQNGLIEKLNKKIKDQEEEKKKQEEEMRKKSPQISKRYTSDSDKTGIISLLGNSVTLSAFAENNPCNLLSNIRNCDNKNFFNSYNNFSPKSESDSYILFDFGSTQKIDLHSYLIRSTNCDPSSNNHPKSWRIEGSNDK